MPWTPINRRAKFDAASFIFGGEIGNRTNKNKTNKITTTTTTTTNVKIRVTPSHKVAGTPYRN